MTLGSFVFMLHSHLPYYRMAGMWPFGEENLYEYPKSCKGALRPCSCNYHRHEAYLHRHFGVPQYSDLKDRRRAGLRP